MGKTERLKKLEEIAEKCYNCELGKTRNRLVFGEGSANSTFMIIGEGPGETEDKEGRPFVGRSGQLLRKMLTAIDLNPEKDVFIANIVKCRPPKNRDPKKNEITTCIKFLRKQIEIIEPKLIILLGKSAVKGICPDLAKESVERLRIISKNLGMLIYNDIPVVVTYHPSALLRTQWRRVGAKEDFEFLQNVYKEFKNDER